MSRFAFLTTECEFHCHVFTYIIAICMCSIMVHLCTLNIPSIHIRMYKYFTASIMCYSDTLAFELSSDSTPVIHCTFFIIKEWQSLSHVRDMYTIMVFQTHCSLKCQPFVFNYCVSMKKARDWSNISSRNAKEDKHLKNKVKLTHISLSKPFYPKWLLTDTGV